MFNDDEDYGFLTGGLGDLDGDGRVDFVEYMNEEDDYQRIMHSDDDDDYSVLDDEDIEMLSEAEELGIDPNDYIDNDELKQALEDYQQIIDSVDDYTALFNNLQNEYGDEEYSDFDDDTNEDGALHLPSNFDISKLTLTIGPKTGLMYDGKPIDEVLAKHHKLQITIESKCKNPYGDYSIRDAIYSKFPEIEKVFPKVDCECFEDAVLKCYRVHKKLGLSIWLWILDNFPHALTSDLETQGTTQSWIICNYILSQFGYRDLATRDDRAYKYLSEHPELETLIFQKSFYYNFPEVVSEYLSYCLAHNLQKNFERVYFGFTKNALISKFINKRELILEKTIEYYSDVYIKSINQEFFIFLKREILSLERNVKQNQILNKLNKLKGNYKK